MTLTYESRETIRRQQRLPFSAEDARLIETALALLGQVYSRRLRIRRIQVQLDELVTGGGTQLRFFEPEARQGRFYEALDAIRHKYGKHIIGRGGTDREG
ncbi:MAG: hypothetical protein D6722_16915 [Bacteroidetes bacterium]|nr:MAG: hypothetical protein D6722_16915 [Bacteroidota bacterium]